METPDNTTINHKKLSDLADAIEARGSASGLFIGLLLFGGRVLSKAVPQPEGLISPCCHHHCAVGRHRHVDYTRLMSCL